MGTQSFAQRLEPAAELTIRRSHVAACTFCAPPDLQRIFADGVIVYYTLVGRDDRRRRRARCPSRSASTSSVGGRAE